MKHAHSHVVPLMVDIFINLEELLMITQFLILFKFMIRKKGSGLLSTLLFKVIPINLFLWRQTLQLRSLRMKLW